jgi:cAMP-dependent protein kinase regulator
MNGNGKAPKAPPRFRSLLRRWKEEDDKCGSGDFEFAEPKREKSGMAQQNEEAIKEYKKSFKAKNFKTKTPTRGMSAFKKPAQLQNVFGAKLEDLTNYKPPVFEKSDKEVAMVKEAMKKKFFFDDMTSYELALFVDAFEPVQVAKETIIIKQGEVGDYFYILAEGGVSFHIEDIQVGDAAQGVSFGELALLYACPRAATVRAETEPTKLYRVDQKTFRSLLQKQTKILEAEKMQLLKNVNFLSEIVESDLKRLGTAMAPKQFEPGDCLVKKGDAGDAFYIVHEGEVAVTDISVGSTTFDDIILKRGDYFGERALATKEPRAANVTAKTKGTAFCIDKGTFEKVLGKFSRVIMKSQNRRTMVRVSLRLIIPSYCSSFVSFSQMLLVSLVGGN